MCIFCGDLSDPFHGLGPAPLMVGTIIAGRAWRGTIRPALVRAGRLSGETVEARATSRAPAPDQHRPRGPNKMPLA